MPWSELPPAKETNQTGVLGDVESRVPRGYPSYRDDDYATWVHEATHGVNARLRNENRGLEGFYCLEGRAFLVPRPEFTLRELADAIPTEKRGRLYRLYLVQQQASWNDRPLYALDECAAYVNGCFAAIEKDREQRTQESFERAIEMWGYVRVCQRLMRERGYQSQSDFDQCLDHFHLIGISAILAEQRRRGWRHP